MYSEQHFRVRVAPRPEGLWVVVSHPPTGRERVQGPVESEAVKAVTRSLIEAMQRELVLPSALRIRTVLALGGQLLQVEHLPTGRTRSAATCGEPLQVQKRLLDELVMELWKSGLIGPAGFEKDE